MVGNLDLLDFFLDFFTELKTNHRSLSVHKSSGDRLEKLDQIDSLIKGAIENWNSSRKLGY